MDKSRLYYQIPYVKSFMCTVEHCEGERKRNLAGDSEPDRFLS